MAKRITHVEFKNRVEDGTDNEYSLLSTYQNSTEKVLIRHNNCNHEYMVRPSKFSFGQRCPKCMRPNYKRSDKDFRKQIFSLVNNEYDILSEIERIDTKVKFRHNVCGHEYMATSHKFINGGRRCPKCANNIKRSTKEYSEYVEVTTSGEYELLGEYETNKVHVEMLHTQCGHKWMVRPDNFNEGKRCPNCNLSHGEQMVEKYLREKSLNYESQYRIKECKIIQPLPFDFAIFNDNRVILIEYDGEQHFIARPFFGGDIAFKKQQERDTFKRNFCKENDIPLIEIPYTIKNINEYLDTELSAYL